MGGGLDVASEDYQSITCYQWRVAVSKLEADRCVKQACQKGLLEYKRQPGHFSKVKEEVDVNQIEKTGSYSSGCSAIGCPGRKLKKSLIRLI
jgi:hypothetical protein